MKKIFYIHWNEEEIRERIEPLKKAGYKVNFHFSTGVTADIKNDLPDILVISIDRLPSHGKAYAEWLWQAKSRQHIPIVFCGGKPDKTEALKQQFPAAIFCSNEELIDTLKRS